MAGNETKVSMCVCVCLVNTLAQYLIGVGKTFDWGGAQLKLYRVVSNLYKHVTIYENLGGHMPPVPPPLIPTSMYLVHATLLSVYHLRDRTEPLLLHSQTLLLFMRESSSTRLQFSQLPHTSTKDTNIKSCPSCKKWCGLHD